MSLRARILADLVPAMKARDKTRTAVIRMLQAEIQNRELALRPTEGADHTLDDDEVLAILGRAVKQRRESVESFRKGGRDDLAVVEESEIAIIQAYLPEALADDDLDTLIDAAIAETGAGSARDIGRVMKALMPRVRGRADGKTVNRRVAARLATGSAEKD